MTVFSLSADMDNADWIRNNGKESMSYVVMCVFGGVGQSQYLLWTWLTAQLGCIMIAAIGPPFLFLLISLFLPPSL